MTRLHDLLTAQAEGRPEKTAIVFKHPSPTFKHQSLTYGELEESSNRLARALKDAGCRRGDRIALLLPKSPEALIAMFAALKADCVYVPLDCASPAPRLARLIEMCESRCVLALRSTASVLSEMFASGLPRIRIGWMDGGMQLEASAAFSWRDVQSYPPGPVDSVNTADDP